MPPFQGEGSLANRRQKSSSPSKSVRRTNVPTTTQMFFPAFTMQTRGWARQVVRMPGMPKRNTGRPVALVLAMIRQPDDVYATQTTPADKLLDFHPRRDTERIMLLEDELDMDVVSFSDTRGNAFDPSKHVSGCFESPPLRVLQEILQGRQVRYIIGDYIRFSPDYLRKVYRGATHTLIPDLEKSGLLTNDCECFMPYPKLHDGVENIYDALERNHEWDLVQPFVNPLYRATDTYEEGVPHMHKTEGLTEYTPFMWFRTLDLVDE